MIAIRFAVSYKEHTECMSSFDDLDSLFARSSMAKKNGYMVS